MVTIPFIEPMIVVSYIVGIIALCISVLLLVYGNDKAVKLFACCVSICLVMFVAPSFLYLYRASNVASNLTINSGYSITVDDVNSLLVNGDNNKTIFYVGDNGEVKQVNLIKNNDQVGVYQNKDGQLVLMQVNSKLGSV